MKMFFNVLGAKIPAYGFFIAIGLCFIMLYLRYQKYYKELDFDTALSAMIYALLIGGAGAKILYWITDPSSFMILFNSKYPLLQRIQYSFSGGMVFLGGLIGAGIGVVLFLKKYKHIKPLKLLDMFAISMPILQMFGRVGCFFAGCCYGRVSNSCIAVQFPKGGLAPAGVSVLPTQLFGVIGNFIIVITLLIYSKKNKHPGRIFGLYLIMYSIGRFIFEFFRGDEIRGIYGALSTSQWISIPLLVLGVILFVKAKEEVYEKNID